MLLVKVGSEKWVMVDCHLPDKGSKARFFAFVERMKINRIDLLCLTHPHEDHYAGMESVIDYFTSANRSLGMFCDTGINPKMVFQALTKSRKPTSAIAEYTAICQKLDKLFGERKVRYCLVSSDSKILFGSADNISLVPIGPSSLVHRWQTVESLRTGRQRGDLNLLSAVLILNVPGPHPFRALLPGDSDGPSIAAALESYGDFTEKPRKTLPRFHAVKVPHHGSYDSHKGTPVAKLRRRAERSVVLISVGDVYRVLPDREVIREYLAEGWSVLSTTKRSTPHSGRLIASFGSTFELESNDVLISWNAREGVVWSPANCEITVADLDFYQTAKEEDATA